MIQNIIKNYKTSLNDTKITLQMHLGHFTEKNLHIQGFIIY